MAREKKPVHRVQMTDGKRNIIQQLLQEYDIETAEDIQDALKDLLGGTIKEMMETEMDNHLGYEKSERSDSDDYRNGYKSKRINSSYGRMDIDVPQDRKSTFEPQVVKKRQKDISDIDQKIISMYAKGMTTRQISETIDYMNRGMALKEIEKDIKIKIEKALSSLKNYQGSSNRVDDKWYYIVPMLLDGQEYVSEWMESLEYSLLKQKYDVEDKGNKGFNIHIERLKEILDSGNIALGKKPEDISQVLTNMVLASPAICAYRMNGSNAGRATELAKVFINRFNTTEATAIIDLAYGKSKDDNAHWKNVLNYCKDGNFQSMLDEYYHIISDSIGFIENHDKEGLIHDIMSDSLKIHSASYSVDTFNNFKSRVNGDKERRLTLRSQFAVGFVKGEGDDSQKNNRKESIRNAFNSPMRPFVLATTSIGQEGLDFHRLETLDFKGESAFHHSLVQWVLSRLLVGEPSHVETVVLLTRQNT